MPVLIAGTAALWLLQPHGSYESRSLLALLNFTLVTCVSAVIALLAARTFAATGLPGTLFLGAGVLAMGAAFAVAPLSGTGGPNFTATVHNVGMLAAGVLSLVGAWMSSRPHAPVRAPAPLMLAAYAGALTLVACTAYLAGTGATPAFFVQGTGGTPLRQAVLASSVGAFGVAGVVLLVAEGNAKVFRRWYGLGLVLIGVGLLGVMLQEALGSPISWVGRFSQYLGSVYLLVASVTSATEARRWSLPLQAELREERTQAQQLRETKDRLARVLEGSSDGYFEWNVQTGWLDFSDRVAELLGYRRTELAPDISTVRGMYHPDDREAGEGALKRLARGELDSDDVYRRLRHKDGHWVWLHVRGKIVERDANGMPTRVSGTCTDVSARKAAETALVEAQRRLALVLDNVREGVHLLDLTLGRFTFVSPSLVEMTGFTVAELERMTPEEALERWHPEDRHISAERQQAISDGLDDLGTVEHRWKVKSGEYRWLSNSRKVVRDREGKATALVGVTRDITERKLAEAKIAESEKRLREVIDGSNDGHFDADFAERVVHVSRRWNEIAGQPLDRDSYRMDEWDAMTHPEDVSPNANAMAAVARGASGRLDIAYRINRPDGAPRWVRTRAKVVERDGSGLPLRMAGTTVDIHEQRVAQDALAASERRLAEVIEGSSDGYFVRDLEAGTVYLSPRMRELHGMPAEGAYADPDGWMSAYHPDDLAREGPAIEALLAGVGDSSLIRLRARMPGGTWEWREGRAKVVDRDADGKPTRIVGTMRDIHALKVAEEALKESETRYARALEATRDGFWDRDLVTARTLHSARMNEIVGLPAVDREADPAEWRGRIHPDDVPAMAPQFERVLAGKQDSIDIQHRVHCEDGSWKWVRSRGKVVERDASGRPTRMVGTVSDITAGKLAALNLAASEARFKVLADLSPVGIFETDLDGNPTYLNGMAGKMLRLPPEAALGEGWVGAIHPDDRDAFLQEWRAAVSGKHAFSREFRVHRPDGSTSIHLASVAPLDGPGGAVAGLIGAMVDITELRAAQEQLQVASRLAALGTLVAGVAHEINNPLVGVTAGLGFAVEDLRDLRGRARQGEVVDSADLCHHMDEVLDSLEDATVGARRISAIVKDLTAFGRSDQRKSRVGLPDVVQDAMRWLPSGSREFVTIDVDSREAPGVVASAPQLTQVVVNLVTNAVKSIPVGKKGLVRVRVGPGAPGKVRLTVEDDGAGMTQGVMDRMFDPFFTTRELGKGTGLGLAVTYAIVKEHGGTITATSEVGKGSTFTVELPAAPAEG